MSKKRNAEEAFSPSNPKTSYPKVSPRNGNPHAVTVQKQEKPTANQTRSNHVHKPKASLHEKAQALLKTRQQLPIWPHANEIREKVRDNDVLLLVGETGSGKSTQIPQFLYLEKWCNPQDVSAKVQQNEVSEHKSKRQQGKRSDGRIGGRIAIIQPRRVAAISLASRVAAEIGTPLGSASPASQVGYSVRFDNNVSPSTRIKFLTDGMMLQELLRDPWLRDYSCVIVDEVHERGVNVDLVLGFLRRILDKQKSFVSDDDQDGRGGVPLKVVIMSATADMEGIEQFFNESGNISTDMNGTVQTEERDWNGFSDEDKNSANIENQETQLTDGERQKRTISVSSCHIQGRQYPVRTSYMSQPVTNLLEATMDRMIHLHQHTSLPGDILVFLSGQEMIENLESLCHVYAGTISHDNKAQTIHSKKEQTQKLPNLQILTLFASLPTHLQARIFQPTPSFTRRIILATNIAETSITVPGIRHVIDTGKHKARLFRPGLNLDTLLPMPISQSMAKQRAGRAGREAPGTCHRLYMEKDYRNLEKDTKPEILSTDLSFLVLTLKAHKVDDVFKFPLLTKPKIPSLEVALLGLVNLDALDEETGAITDIGRKMAMLPVRPDLARCLLEGSRYSQTVMEGVIDIVAALSLEEGIFLPIRSGTGTVRGGKKATTSELLLGKRAAHGTSTGADTNAHENVTLQDDDVKGNHDGNALSDSDSDSSSTDPITLARRSLLARHSDHLTLLNAISAYTAPTTHDRRVWCDQHGISHRAMARIMDVRKQLRQMMNDSRYRLTSADVDSRSTEEVGVGAADEITRKEKVLKCLVAGLWSNIAVLSSLAPSHLKEKVKKVNPNQIAPYTMLSESGQGVYVHPSSVVFTSMHHNGGRTKNGKGEKTKSGGGSALPPAVLFTDLTYTSKPYARNVSAIDLSWLVEMGKIS